MSLCRVASRLDTLLGHLSQAMLQEGHRLKAWGFLDTGTGAELLQSRKRCLVSSRTYGKVVPMLELNPCILDDRDLKTQSSTPKTPAEAEVEGVAKQVGDPGNGRGLLFDDSTQKKRGAQKWGG